MKRSPPPPPTSSSSSSSSSSSCIGPDIPHQSDKIKAKRVRKTHNPNKCLQNANGSAAASSGGGGGGGRRSSIYRGVTRHRWTGRFEAHLWDKSSWNNIQNKKGRQVYLGAYDNEEAAAHTYDLAALKYWGPGTTLNFPIETYTKELEEMQNVTKEEYLASLRRRSSGFSRGVSKYRGVARHHHNGRWEARIGRVFGNKYLYLGTYNTQEEAAAAYDMAAIEYRGANAVTNFDISNYIDRLKKKIPGFNVQSLTESEALPNCCTRSEVEVEQPPPLPPQKQQDEMVLEQQQPHYTQLPPCMDTTSSMEVLDPAANEQGLWSFIDTGFAPLTVPDLPLGKPCELTDLFDHAAFEDDIHLIFEAASNQDDGNNMNGSEVVGVSRSMEEDNVQDRLLLSSSTSYSPSSSTTTSVSCIYSA